MLTHGGSVGVRPAFRIFESEQVGNLLHLALSRLPACLRMAARLACGRLLEFSRVSRSGTCSTCAFASIRMLTHGGSVGVRLALRVFESERVGNLLHLALLRLPACLRMAARLACGRLLEFSRVSRSGTCSTWRFRVYPHCHRSVLLGCVARVSLLTFPLRECLGWVTCWGHRGCRSGGSFREYLRRGPALFEPC